MRNITIIISKMGFNSLIPTSYFADYLSKNSELPPSIFPTLDSEPAKQNLVTPFTHIFQNLENILCY